MKEVNKSIPEVKSNQIMPTLVPSQISKSDLNK